MKNFFKPEYFDREGVDAFNWQEKSAHITNEKLNKLIESWPVVFFSVTNGLYSTVCTNTDTRKARLAFIEEIKKEPCLHLPYRKAEPGHPYDNWACSRCGVELVAEWTEKK